MDNQFWWLRMTHDDVQGLSFIEEETARAKVLFQTLNKTNCLKNWSLNQGFLITHLVFIVYIVNIFFRQQKSSLSWNIGRDVCLSYYCWTVGLFQTRFQNLNIRIGTIFICPEVPNCYPLRHGLKAASSYPALVAFHTALPSAQH